MKIRSDYVSNSSSSSFIIDFEDKGACIDEDFMKLLKHLNEIMFSGTCETIEQLKELREKANALFDNRIDDCSDEDDLYFSFSISTEYIVGDDADRQIDFIKQVLQLKNGKIYANAGEDYGYELTRAVQIATMLEMKYKQIGINGVWRISVVPASVLVKPVVADPVNPAVSDAKVHQFFQVQVLIVPGSIPGAVPVRLPVFGKAGINDRIAVFVRSHHLL